MHTTATQRRRELVSGALDPNRMLYAGLLPLLAGDAVLWGWQGYPLTALAWLSLAIACGWLLRR